MTKFLEKTFFNGNKEYRIELGFDDKPIMKVAAKFEIDGKVREMPEGKWAKINLVMEVQFEINEIIIKRKDDTRILARISLDTILPESESFDGIDIDIEKDDLIISENLLDENGINISAKFTEELISSIPTDPLIGCLVKGALSTVTGQILRCWQTTKKAKKEATKKTKEVVNQQKTRSMYGCMREYSVRMLVTFMYRSGKCIATLGMA